MTDKGCTLTSNPKVFRGELFVTEGPHKGGYLPGQWVRADEIERLTRELADWKHARETAMAEVMRLSDSEAQLRVALERIHSLAFSMGGPDSIFEIAREALRVAQPDETKSEGYSQEYADQMRTALLEIVSHPTASSWECKPLAAIAARGLGAAVETFGGT